jgi:hypothetical protein
MLRDVDRFLRLRLPLTLATHHWELADDGVRARMHGLLDHLAGRPDVRFVPLDEVFSVDPR